MVQYAKIVLATRDRELQTFPNKYSVWITLLTIFKEYTIMAKKDYKPRTFESNPAFLPKKESGKAITDTSANIYMSMLQSQAWHNLTYKQKELYLYCKAQQFGERKKKSEHLTEKEREENVEIDISKRFTMNKSKWCAIYGLYTESTQRHFYEDMRVLMANGFIISIEKGQNSRTKNIYEYSDKWRELGKWGKE